MAILKNIPIHASGLATSKSTGISKAVRNVVDYIDDSKKNSYLKRQDDIDRVLTYDINDEKTMIEKKGIQKILVSYIGTSKSTISDDFNDLMEKYYETHKKRNYRKENENGKTKKEIVSFHFIQSFEQSPSDLNPETVHQIGKEWLTSMGYIGVVSTHMDTDNIHNHILVCPFPQHEAEKRLIMNRTTWREACALNDEICQSHGLDTLDKDRTVKGRHREGERDGSAVHREKRARQAGNSYKEQLRRDIDSVIARCRSWSDFVYEMENSEWEIRNSGTGKTVTAVAMSNEKHRARLNRLGEGYSKEDIINRIKHNREIEKEVLQREEEWTRQKDDYQTSVDHQKNENEKTDIADVLRQASQDRIGRIMNRQYTISPRKRQKYDVDRYSSNGRRRSDLELFLLELIRLLVMIKDAILETFTHIEEKENNESIVRQYNSRVEAINIEVNSLKKCLEIATRYKSIDELRQSKTEIGKKLNVAKSELLSMKQKDAYYKNVIHTINDYKRLHNLNEYIVSDFIPVHSNSETQRFLAEYYPTTKEQRKELYRLISNNEMFRIEGKWNTLNYEEANQVIDFLKGKLKHKPERLIPKYQKSEVDPDFSENNSKKEREWLEYLKSLPEDIRTDVDRLYHVMDEMSLLGIKDDINMEMVDREIRDHKWKMVNKAREIEDFKNAYMKVLKVEKVIVNAQSIINAERDRTEVLEKDDIEIITNRVKEGRIKATTSEIR